MLLGAPVARAQAPAPPAVAPSAACPALVGTTVNVPHLAEVLASGVDPNGTCPVTRAVRRRLGFLELMVGVLVPPLGVAMMINPGTTSRTEAVPMLTLAVGWGSMDAVDVLLGAGADPLSPSDGRQSPLHAAVAADLTTDEARWTHRLLRDRTVPSDVLCTDTSTLDALLKARTVRQRLEAAGMATGGRDCGGATWLHRAAQSGHNADVQAIVASGDVRVDAPDGRGRHAVFLAAQREHWDTVAWLVEAGAPLKGAGGEQGSILHEAARGKRLDLIQDALTEGVPINDIEESGQTPLRTAVRAGWPEGVAVLLVAGAKPALGQGGEAALLHDAVMGGSVDVLRTLLDGGLSPALRGPGGGEVLEDAWHQDALDLAAVLVAHGARLELIHFGSGAESALEAALRRKRMDWVALLMPISSAAVLEDAVVDSLIHHDLDGVAVLLDAGADGRRGLAWMAAWGRDTDADWLRERGVRYPEDALNYMIPEASFARVTQVLDEGALAHPGTPHRHAPVDLALDAGQAEVVGLLVQRGAPVPDSLWRDALRTDDPQWVHALVAAGVPPDLDAVERAVLADAPLLLAELLPSAGLDRRDLRRLMWTARGQQAGAPVKDQLKAARDQLKTARAAQKQP